METVTQTETAQTRTSRNARRGNFYFGLGFVLLAGLLVVVGLGVVGITGLGFFEVGTAMAMIAIAITLLSIVTFVTLLTMRRTLSLLNQQDLLISEQTVRHADLASKVQAQWRAAQVIRDRNQDADLANLSARQDASFVDAQARTDRARMRPSGRGPNVAHADPFGDIHPVRDIEGIGEHYGKLLDAAGLTDTRKLWNADAKHVAGVLQIHPTVVENWQCMAELMAINGIGKQYAELLVRAGVSSIDGLCEETAQPLLNRIHRLENHQGNRIQGNTIGTKIVQSWIAAAQAHHGASPRAPFAVRSNGPNA